MKSLNIVLYSPEIPQNTGNISRTAAVTGAALYQMKRGTRGCTGAGDISRVLRNFGAV